MGNKCTGRSKKNSSDFKKNESAQSSAQLIYILTTYYNPGHYKIRSKLYQDFKAQIISLKLKGIELITIECAFGNDQFEVTKQNNEPYEIQLRAPHPLSIKENLLNIGLSKLKSDDKFLKNCRYVAWIDHDIQLVNPNLWADGLKSVLSKHSIVQIFGNCQSLGMHNEIIENKSSFAFSLSANSAKNIDTGYGWATTKENLFDLDGLYQENVLGLNDRHFAYGLIGNFNEGFDAESKISSGYEKNVFEWMKKAEKIFKKNIGFINAPIRHHWHGKPENRAPKKRWILLKECNFDPTQDLKVLENGVLQLKYEKGELQRAIYQWFYDRKEDEIFKPAINNLGHNQGQIKINSENKVGKKGGHQNTKKKNHSNSDNNEGIIGGFDVGLHGGHYGGYDGGQDGGNNGGYDGGYDGGNNGGNNGGYDGGNNEGYDGGYDGGNDGGNDGGYDGGNFGGDNALY